MRKMLKRFFRKEDGLSLLEALVAVALLGIIAVAFLNGLFVSSRSVQLGDNLATAESLARTMMEQVKNGPFAGEYNDYILPDEYADSGYSFTIEADTVKAGLQKITVNIFHDGIEIYSLEGYKRH